MKNKVALWYFFMLQHTYCNKKKKNEMIRVFIIIGKWISLTIPAWDFLEILIKDGLGQNPTQDLTQPGAI